MADQHHYDSDGKYIGKTTDTPPSNPGGGEGMGCLFLIALIPFPSIAWALWVQDKKLEQALDTMKQPMCWFYNILFWGVLALAFRWIYKKLKLDEF